MDEKYSRSVAIAEIKGLLSEIEGMALRTKYNVSECDIYSYGTIVVTLNKTRAMLDAIEEIAEICKPNDEIDDDLSIV